MSLTKVKAKFQVTIPTEVRRTLHLGVGDFLEATVKNNVIVLKPKTMVDRETVDTAIGEGLADLKAGRTTPAFSSVKEFKTFLKK